MKKVMLVTLALTGNLISSHAASYSAPTGSWGVLQGNFQNPAQENFNYQPQNGNADRAGTGGAATSTRVNVPILNFALPTLGAGEAITNATFSVQMAATALNGTPSFDFVASVMQLGGTNAITSAHYADSTAAVNSTLAGGIVLGQLGTTDVANNSTETFTLTGAALTFLNSLYNVDGTPTQSEVIFRLNASAFIDTGDLSGSNDPNNNLRYNFSDAANGGGDVTRSLVIQTIPEPATLGLVVAFGGALLFIRRRFMI